MNRSVGASRVFPQQPAAGPPRPPAVIVGLEENGLGVARSLAAAGVKCIAVTTPEWSCAYATRLCHIVRAPEWTCERLMETLVRIGEKLDSRAPLLLTKDEPVLWVSEHRERLSRYYEINLPPPDVVDLLMSKPRFGALANGNGWPIPQSHTVRNREDVEELLDRIAFPCILKPAIKNSAFRAHAPAKAFRAASAQELVGAYDLVSTWESEAVVQEWIEGGDSRICYCLVYYDRRGEPLAMFPGRKLRQRPPGCGNTAIAAPVPDEWRDPILRLTREIFASVGFRGLGSIEYKLRPDNSLVIMEPTVGRTNWQSEIAVLNGVNIPAIACFDLLAQSWSPAIRRSLEPCKLVDGRADLWALRQTLKPGGLRFSQWLEDRRGRKRYMRWRVSDPGPTIAALGYFLFRSLRYLLRLPRRLVQRSFKSKVANESG